jgi:hypothetical protein
VEADGEATVIRSLDPSAVLLKSAVLGVGILEGERNMSASPVVPVVVTVRLDEDEGNVNEKYFSSDLAIGASCTGTFLRSVVTPVDASVYLRATVVLVDAVYASTVR